ncbi:SMI1/KNR4 family protein [Leptospira venezuelensis]|uniref:SMI1/KNR4 family protein n=1 Tax=Leptospira venezuelensis TaxID=1958811 RepID=UPI000A3B540B|nr:SMI1/KNR4 family protein [Leptospira venezuelensis]
MLQKLIEKLYMLTWKKTKNKEELLNPGSKLNLKELPSPLQKLYLIADGQKEEFPNIFLGHSFMTLSDSLEAKKILDELAEEENWEKEWWDKNWYPFGDGGTGDHLVLDKETGKVLEFIHDSEDRPEYADSIENYLKDLIEGLESGKFYFDPKLGIFNTEQPKTFKPEKSKINWKEFWLDVILCDKPRGFGFTGRIIQTFVFIFYVCLVFLFKWIYSHYISK